MYQPKSVLLKFLQYFWIFNYKISGIVKSVANYILSETIKVANSKT